MTAENRELVKAKEKKFQEKVKNKYGIILKNVGHGNTGGGLVGESCRMSIYSIVC